MDGTSPDKLGFKGRMLIFTALEKTYGRECAFDIATKSDDHVLKLVAIAAADEQAAQTLLHGPSPPCARSARAHLSTTPRAGSAASIAPSTARATTRQGQPARPTSARRSSRDTARSKRLRLCAWIVLHFFAYQAAIGWLGVGHVCLAGALNTGESFISLPETLFVSGLALGMSVFPS